jgi:hypothetical protein
MSSSKTDDRPCLGDRLDIKAAGVGLVVVILLVALVLIVISFVCATGDVRDLLDDDDDDDDSDHHPQYHHVHNHERRGQ